MTPTRVRALELAALACLLLVAFAAPLGQAVTPLPEVAASDLDVGESLIHRVGADNINSVTTSMPLATAWTAFEFGHLDWRAARAAWLILGALLLLSAGALACELAPWPAAVAAVLLLASGSGSWLPLSNSYHCVYALLVLLVAWSLVRFVRKPGLVAGAVAGATIGACLLYRSPLLFLPPLLACGFLLRRVRRDRATLRGLALAVFVPVAMLLPWTKLNWDLHGRLNPAEHMRSDTNIVSGALGLVANIEGDIRALSPEAQFTPGRVLGWSVRRVLSDPLAYAGAVGQRVVYAAAFTPWLFLFGLAALWVLRRDRAALAVGGLGVYFLGIHSLMPISSPYLIPLRVLLAVLIASAVAKVAFSRLSEESLSRRYSQVLLDGSVAAIVVLAVVSLALVCRYDAGVARVATKQSWQAADAAAPRDPWLLRRRAEQALREGRPLEAAQDLALALRRAPLDAEVHSLFGYALSLRGRPAVLEGLRLAPEATNRVRFELGMYRSAAALRRGKKALAGARAREAIAAWTGTSLTVNRLKTPLERTTLSRLRPPPLTEIVGVVLSPLTPSEQGAFLEVVAGAAPPEHVADAAAVAGFLLLRTRPADSLRLLKRAVAANPTGVCLLSPESYGGPSRARLPLGFFDACLASLPGNAKLWTDRGVARAMARRPGAESDLRQALTLQPDSEEALLSLAFVLEGSGRSAEARELVEGALSRGPGGVLHEALLETATRLKSSR